MSDWRCSCGYVRPMTGSYGCPDCGDPRPDPYEPENTPEAAAVRAFDAAQASDSAIRAWRDLCALVPAWGVLESRVYPDGTYVIHAAWDFHEVVRSAPTWREAVGLASEAVREALA